MTDPGLFVADEEKPPAFTEAQVNEAAERIMPKAEESTDDDDAEVTDALTETPAEEVESAPTPESDDDDDDNATDQDQADDDDAPIPDPVPVTESESDIEYEPGQRISRDVVRNYVAFDQILQNNPELSQIISSYLNGNYAAPQGSGPSVPAPSDPTSAGPQTSIPTPPADLDLDDPNIRFLYDQVQAQQSQLVQQQEYLQSIYPTINKHEQFLVTKSQQDNTAIVNRAVESFKKQNNYTDDEIMAIRQVAGRMKGVVDQMLETGIDPVTGIQVSDTLTVVERALEIARDTIPQYRERAIQAAASQLRTDSTRKRKLGALSGSGGTTSRKSPAPSTPREYEDAMRKELESVMSGNNISE